MLMSTKKRLTLTVQEAADLLGISTTLAYKLVNEEGELAGVKVIQLGKRFVISRAALEGVLNGLDVPKQNTA
jgi:excisionase family DNA binding protein